MLFLLARSFGIIVGALFLFELVTNLGRALLAPALAACLMTPGAASANLIVNGNFDGTMGNSSILWGGMAGDGWFSEGGNRWIISDNSAERTSQTQFQVRAFGQVIENSLPANSTLELSFDYDLGQLLTIRMFGAKPNPDGTDPGGAWTHNPGNEAPHNSDHINLSGGGSINHNSDDENWELARFVNESQATGTGTYSESFVIDDDYDYLFLTFAAEQRGNPSYISNVTLIPEPGTAALLGLAGLTLLARRRRR